MSFLDVYLDIDGVLLADHRTPALHVKEFLTHILKYFPDSTYWLTTHCKGDAQTVFDHVGHLFDAETVTLMRRIKSTNWDVAKTEAINFERTFVWFDDDCFDFERKVLVENGALDGWVEVNLQRNPHQLRGFIENFPLPVNRAGRHTA